ncbi:DNA-3-methyladenine glycosylase [Pseudalkalibacillus sp. SCS-8]|uniref:DNA-3-methyladenine glycosylase n=1 Tax=Pseudalkalibacillus nanhaiensis TaxID=3115291 RepID=UPI0032DAD07B
MVNKDFFKQPTLEVARQLLGMELVHETGNGRLAGKIVEVEAYKGPEDKAAHSYGGRRTARTEVMYGEPGHVYMFLIYGMHHCFNIVTGPLHKPEAILLRALEPTEGVELMLENRYGVKESYTRNHERNLTNGPGKLSKAMGFNMNHYGLPLQTSEIKLQEYDNIKDEFVEIGPRINIDYAEEHVSLPYRFSIKNHAYISK